VKLSKKKPTSYLVDVLTNCTTDSVSLSGPSRAPVLLPVGESGTPEVVPVKLDRVDAFSSIRVYVPKVNARNEAPSYSCKLRRF
jgi:hypothetical protein